MSRILTGVCEADPARRLYKVAVSRGNTFLSAKERFRVQVCFKNAITHPDEDRLLAELLTVHHFLADTSILWYMEKKTYACSGNDSNLLIVFYVQIMPDDLVMQLHRF
ncbi:Uncharacterised protein [Klebsiella pneumoniae]|nr:Uncharacterised protein [Klebsiella pneumoniae]